MSFLIGFLLGLWLDAARTRYFRKHRIQMMAYELIEQDKYWNFDYTQAERNEYIRRATVLFDKAHGK
jgi:hypothetical protein